MLEDAASPFRLPSSASRREKVEEEEKGDRFAPLLSLSPSRSLSEPLSVRGLDEKEREGQGVGVY